MKQHLKHPIFGIISQAAAAINADAYVIENDGSKLFVVTNLNAPNQKIVTVEANNPGIDRGKIILKIFLGDLRKSRI